MPRKECLVVLAFKIISGLHYSGLHDIIVIIIVFIISIVIVIVIGVIACQL